MFKSDLFRAVATLACTIVFSATAVIAAVGPAQGSVTIPTTAIAARGGLTA